MPARKTLKRLAAATLVGGLSFSTQALDLEVPDAVMGPYGASSPWGIAPLLAPDPEPIDSPWSWWQEDPVEVGLAEMASCTVSALADWHFALTDGATDSIELVSLVLAQSRPMLIAIAQPSEPQIRTAPSAPAFVTLPLQIALALESSGMVSLDPHADLAWAQAPKLIEEPFRMITFMGEGEKPHGTLDFAGHPPATGTIAAE